MMKKRLKDAATIYRILIRKHKLDKTIYNYIKHQLFVVIEFDNFVQQANQHH